MVFAAAIDMRRRGGVEAYSLVVASLARQDDIIRYSDFFKHMRKLGSYRRIYVPKMVAIVTGLVDSGAIAGLVVATSPRELVRLVASRHKSIRLCILDDTVAKSHTRQGARVIDILRPVKLVIEESRLRKPDSRLEESVHSEGAKLVFLRTLQAISDNVASYARALFEEELEKIPRTWRL